jgi:hypothetical protein
MTLVDSSNIFRGNLKNNMGYTFHTRFIDPRLPFPYLRSHMDLRYLAKNKNSLRFVSSHGSSGGPQMYGGSLTSTLLNMANDELMNRSDKYKMIMDAVKLAKSTGEKLYDIYGSEMATSIKNNVARHYDKNPLARPAYAGEKMLYLPTKYGYSQANFCGSNVRLRERMERKDQGVDGPNGLDEQCGKYKIRITNAKNKEEKNKALDNLITDLNNSKGSKNMKSMLKTYYKGKRLMNKLEVNNTNINDDNEDELELRGGKYEKKRKYKKKLPGTSLRKKMYKLYS